MFNDYEKEIKVVSEQEVKETDFVDFVVCRSVD